MLSVMLIRDVTPDDWPAIWPFLRGIVARGDTFTYPRDLDEATARDMWMLQAPSRTVVAVREDGTVLGTAKMNRNHMGGSAHISSASFMVAPEHSGHGVGRALGEEVLRWARAEGYRGMQFNAVVASNVRAVGLYESLGFEVIGTIPEGFLHPDEGYVGLHIMYRGL